MGGHGGAVGGRRERALALVACGRRASHGGDGEADTVYRAVAHIAGAVPAPVDAEGCSVTVRNADPARPACCASCIQFDLSVSFILSIEAEFCLQHACNHISQRLYAHRQEELYTKNTCLTAAGIDLPSIPVAHTSSRICDSSSVKSVAQVFAILYDYIISSYHTIIH